MGENLEKKNKKTLFILLLAFIFVGSAIFLFFAWVGLEDIKGEKTGGFRYGFSSLKRAGIPLFRYLGLVDSEDTPGAKSGDFKDDNTLLADSSPAMGDETGDPGGINPGSGSLAQEQARSYGKTNVPKMGSKLAGIDASGGPGSSKSSAELSKFASTDKSGEVKVSSLEKSLKSSQGRDNAKTAALSALKNTRQVVADAKFTNSALEARARWGAGFEGPSSARGKLSYGQGTNVAKLDAIKGDVMNLKAMQEKSLGSSEPGKPKEGDTDSPSLTAKNAPEEAKKKENTDTGSISPSGTASPDGNDKAAPKDPEPPQEVRDFMRDYESKEIGEVTDNWGNRGHGRIDSVTYSGCENNSVCQEWGVKSQGYWTATYADGSTGKFSVTADPDYGNIPMLFDGNFKSLPETPGS
ncbi:MAG: hypothetical protein HY746_05295 [Elusimicrobia bacterium]|nr:hypothetical protein [Elusimicrobiota bacterium]